MRLQNSARTRSSGLRVPRGRRRRESGSQLNGADHNARSRASASLALLPLAAVDIIGAVGCGNALNGGVPTASQPLPRETASAATPVASQTVQATPSPTPAPAPALPAVPAPARTTAPPAAPAPPPSPASPAPPVGCHPLSNEGTCYEPGEFCRNTDHGVTGVAGDGKTIRCEDNDGWRWEPVP